MHETPTCSPEQLSALSELPRWTVRFYIQASLVDHPDGIELPPSSQGAPAQ
jgi:hypothetical protein